MSNRTIRHLTITTDIILINLAFWLAFVVRYEWRWLENVYPVQFDQIYVDYLSQQFVLSLLLIFTFLQNKIWRRRRGESWIDEMMRISTATAAAIMLMTAVTIFIKPTPFSRLMLIWVLLFIILLISIARLLRRWTLAIFYRRGISVNYALVVGSGEVGRSVIRTLLARTDLGYKILGYLHDGQGENNIGSGRIPHLGDYRQLEDVIQANQKLHTVFIALPGDQYNQTLEILQTCQKHGLRAQVVPDLLQLSLNRVEFNNMAGIPMLGVRDMRRSQWGRALKRGLDLGITLVLGVPVALVTAVIAVAIKLDSPGPVIYSAERVGHDSERFKMYKFRSMVEGADKKKALLHAHNEADGPIFKIKEDPRLTRVGRFIRRTSLDELPQLYNVLRGEMSWVGPRPPLPEEVAEYKPWQHQRLSVIGGITGLWQVSGRSDLTFDELCLLDIYYIENWSLTLDLRILLQTIPYALFGRGAY